MAVSELQAAPGDLGVLQALVNTVDRLHGTELLTGPRALAGWLSQAGLLGPDAELARLRIRVAADGATRLEAVGEGLDRVFGRFFAIFHEARGAGTWPRLKACAQTACRAAFHDFSPNRSGVWCEMQRCGNRVKSQAFRNRAKRRGY